MDPSILGILLSLLAAVGFGLFAVFARPAMLHASFSVGVMVSAAMGILVIAILAIVFDSSALVKVGPLDLGWIAFIGLMNLALFEGSEGDAKWARHPWWDGCCGKGACLQVNMPPGEATMMSICSTREGGWRMVVTTCEVTGRAPVPLGAPNFFVKPDRPITAFIEDWGKAGAAHHLAMAYGDWTPHIRALSKLLDVEYLYL